MTRIIEDLINITLFDDSSCIHDIHIVRNLRHNAKVMRDVDNGKVGFCLDFLDQFKDLRLNRNIKRRCRLITDQNIRFTGKRNRDDNTLTHTAGEFVRILFEPLFRILDSYLRKEIDRTLFRFRLGKLQMQDHAFHDLLSDRHGRIERGHRILEYHGNMLAAETITDFLLGKARHVDGFLFPFFINKCIVDRTAVNMTVVRKDSHDRLDRYGFTGTGLTDDGDGFPAEQVHTDAADRMYRTACGIKTDVQVTDRQYAVIQIFWCRHNCSSFTSVSCSGQTHHADRPQTG